MIGLSNWRSIYRSRLYKASLNFSISNYGWDTATLKTDIGCVQETRCLENTQNSTTLQSPRGIFVLRNKVPRFFISEMRISTCRLDFGKSHQMPCFRLGLSQCFCLVVQSKFRGHFMSCVVSVFFATNYAGFGLK